MAVVPVSTQASQAGGSSPGHRLESAEHQGARLETQLQRLVERAALLVEAQEAQLSVMDPASQTLELVSAWSERFSRPPLANQHIHEELARWAKESFGQVSPYSGGHFAHPVKAPPHNLAMQDESVLSENVDCRG